MATEIEEVVKLALDALQAAENALHEVQPPEPRDSIRVLHPYQIESFDVAKPKVKQAIELLTIMARRFKYQSNHSVKRPFALNH